jgi:cytochrome c551/c552
MKHPITLTASVALLAVAHADEPKAVFQVQCAACHAVDRVLVGPSLVEIAGIYRNNPEGFLQWCMKPGRKRLAGIEMPSMAAVGEPTLRQLHAYILKEAAGKKEQKASGVDPFAVPRAQVRRPQVQRMFLPDASPAAIAVALPGDLSYCFDASECRLRYVWKGGFLNASAHWLGNGSKQASIDGEVLYREPAFPLIGGSEGTVRFIGYSTKDGLPSFRYTRGGMQVVETIRPLADGSGIERAFEIENAAPLKIEVAVPARAESSSGSLALTAAQAKSFTLTLRWK